MKNMKYRLLTALLLCAGLFAKAQISMTAQVPAAGVLQKAQLWNILLVSASEQPVDVRIILRLSDPHTNQPILTGVSRIFTLTKGARQLTVQDAGPIAYEYLSPNVDRSINGLLTVGNYLACYSLEVVNIKFGEQAVEDCVPFAVEPLAPPMLNMPADKSQLDAVFPQFTWLPPAPVNVFTDLNYDLLLTEVRTGQSPDEAIQQNAPVFTSTHIKDLYYNYPASGVALDTSKTYAWTVIARNAAAFAAQTEVWTFKLKGLPGKPHLPASAYVQLRKELDGNVAALSGSLKFYYMNVPGDKSVHYEIIGLNEQNTVVGSGEVNLQPGDNMLELPVEKGMRLLSQKTYLFRVLNSRNEYWQMKFVYSQE